MEISHTPNPEFHLHRSMEVKREQNELMWDMERALEKILINKIDQLPAITINDKELMTFDGQRVTIKPEIYEDNYPSDKRVGVAIKCNTEPKQIKTRLTAENITQQDLEKYKSVLTRPYRGIDTDKEKAWIFKDSNKNPVGWVVVSDNGNRHSHIGFIGVNKDKENLGAGSEILAFLKINHDALTLTDLAYDSAGIGHEESVKRLKRFYVKNGFYNTSSGMEWAAKTPNIETAQEVHVQDEVAIGGERFSKNFILETYLKTLSERQIFIEIFDQKEIDLIKSWTNLRKDYRQLDSEAEEYYRQTQTNNYSGGL